MSTSELIKLREQIELECQAIQHLMDFSVVASHRVIDRRYRNLDQYCDQLKSLVGDDQATGRPVFDYDIGCMGYVDQPVLLREIRGKQLWSQQPGLIFSSQVVVLSLQALCYSP